MPTVKLNVVRSSKKYEKYNSKERGAELEESAPEGLDGHMADAIAAEHARFPNARVKNFALTIYQNWPEQESNRMSLEKYNQMGRELAERFAPGHLAWVVTHTDTPNWHNHITFCSVNSETGKIFRHDKPDIARMHNINNDIARENGFALVVRRDAALRAKLSDKARKMIYQGKKSWILDLAERIDFARATSTTFDEFVGAMKGMSVQTRIEKKNITYIFGEEGHTIRGKHLGTNFDKIGLMEGFKENDERFANVPGLRTQLSSELRATFDSQGNRVGTPGDLLSQSRSHQGLGKKDYSAYTKLHRGHDADDLPAIFDQRGGVLYNEMKKAREVSIFDYCKREKIKLATNAKGETTVAGRDFIKLTESEVTNTKNGRKGNILDFVAAYHDTDYLRATAKINRTDRLLILEQSLGDYKKPYQTFFIRKPSLDSPQEQRKSLRSLLFTYGGTEKQVDILSRHAGVHGGIDKSVWFINEKKDGAVEYKRGSGDTWQAKRHGNPHAVFSEKVGTSPNLFVFRSPIDFAQHTEKGAHHFGGNDSVLILFENEANRRVDELLALHPHIKQVSVAHSMSIEQPKGSTLSVDTMNAKLNPFDIRVKALQLGDMGRDRGKGPDIGM